jgi:phosphatidylglycerophosphate synthase
MKIKHQQQTTLFTLPNLLSGYRFVAAPGLLWLAWHGHGISFMILLASVFLSDALDGLAARLTGQVTLFGAMLDSWADVTTYLTITISVWWLWPDIVSREQYYVAIVIVSYLLPAIVGLVKFGSFTSYHTWSVKLAAASIALTLFILFLGGPAWPFRLASFICIIAACEEIAISLILIERRTDITSILNVLKHNSALRESETDQTSQ